MTSLVRYIFLVKNLRGVFIPLDGEEASRLSSWLARRFRYRDVGVSGETVRLYPDAFQGRLDGNPFHVIDYPIDAARRAGEAYVKALEEQGVPRLVGESVALSLYYASPLLASSKLLNLLEDRGLIAYTVRGPKLSRQDARLHMRIAGYTVLDSLVALSERARECICNGKCSRDQLLNERREFMEKDAKRYWRVESKGEEPILAYLDPLKTLTLDDKLCTEEGSVLLAVPVLFNLDTIEETG